MSDTTVVGYCQQIKVFPFAAIYKKESKNMIALTTGYIQSELRAILIFLQFHEADATCSTLFLSLSQSVSSSLCGFLSH